MATKLGKLSASILIDNPTRPRYGPNDPITGRLILRYNPATALFKKDPITADLFGPLRINVVLVGQIRIKIRRDRDLPTHHGGTLFAVPFHVYDGPFKGVVNTDYSFPFEARFPAIGDGGGSLPPTFASHFSDYPDVVDVAVLYHMGAKVEMPGIDIKVTVPEGNNAPQVRYDIPRPPLSFITDNTSVFSQRDRVQNEYLLPESLRPSGFKAKAKAVFSSSQFPVFAFEVFCTDQKHIHPGQRLTFNVRIIRNDKASSSTDGDFFPTMTLEGFKADVKSSTVVDASSRIIGSSQCYDSKTVQSLTCQTKFPIEFRKEWSADITTGPVMNHTTSFEHVKTSRTYKLKVSLSFKIANKSIKVVKECPVVMLPPPLDIGVQDLKIEEPPPPIEAGPSGTRDDDEDVDAPPPTYEEAGSSKLLKSG
ncbi:hypothetical protein M409DRAFT_25210 [Zasmidium cellare ATCC 36951]|uniref:Arrestin-like N-terminal domain-containing protein n=1 Tax=Zasmidium cellare ATCC 36951 TaxID=1080233 RepID=A0A6A6CBB9_ZASCE|nr:uncharacterized protein M409DRAFT_25210 [Zasmidium cellare ATCC 36951]KAF2164331.1 hypothetical protein M409DRAFT_25210 [Zasmidium cellare ATCC 36951]